MNELSQALPVTSVLIIGSGLIGASIGLGLRQCGVEVRLEDVNPDALALAQDRVSRTGGTGTPREPVEGDPDVVIVAVPPAASASVISKALGTYLKATVSDVCSTKTQLQREVEISGADMTRFVPGHPMAGREVSGPGASSADLFEGRVWALTPSPVTDTRRTAQMSSLVQQLGALVVMTTPMAHDRAVALTSHTPQVVASMVAAGLESLGDGDVLLSGQGLRDVTRLAASDPDLWTEILASNAEPVATALDGLIERLAHVRDGLRAGPSGASVVRAGLASGVSGHRRVPGKWQSLTDQANSDVSSSTSPTRGSTSKTYGSSTRWEDRRDSSNSTSTPRPRRHSRKVCGAPDGKYGARRTSSLPTVRGI